MAKTVPTDPVHIMSWSHQLLSSMIVNGMLAYLGSENVEHRAGNCGDREKEENGHGSQPSNR